jgi:histidinol-phosphate aminotransferase
MSENPYLRSCVESNPGYVPGEQPRPGEMVKLNTNENPYPPSPRISEVYRNLDIGSLRMYPDPLCSQLRKTAARVWGVSDDMLVLGNGSDESLAMIMHACIELGDSVVFAEPTYSYYETITRLFGGKMVKVPCGPDFMPPENLAELRGKITFIASPNPPIGSFVSDQYIAEVCQGLMGKGVVVVDEAYTDFAGHSAIPLLKQYENMIVVRTLSKSYSLAGLRLGFAIGNPLIMEGIAKVRDPLNIDDVAQNVACIALDDQQHLKDNLEKVISERTRMREELMKRGFSVPESYGNFLFAAHHALPGIELLQRLRERKILVRHFKHQCISHGVRITIGTPEENNLLLQAIADINI